MIISCLGWACVILAAVPALLFIVNLFFYRPLPEADASEDRGISVLIPARNEETNIAASVKSALRNEGVILEVIVMDDHSEDRTAEIVSGIEAEDPRVRSVKAPELPAGWCGKQHACAALATKARYPLFVFLDADVRLAPVALRRIAAFMESSGVDLASGFPREETGSLGEATVIPLIHFLLLGFLPMPGMRYSRRPSYAAGCGQLLVARREAYEKVGGHAAIRSSLHDGLTLPRAFRKAGFRTDLFDATPLARCRMYQGSSEAWNGLTKNAIEGIAAPARIVPFTTLLIGGQVMPFVLLAAAVMESQAGSAVALPAIAAGLAYLPRLLGAFRFRQSVVGVALHPIGVGVLVAAQWVALYRWVRGRPALWKGRRYAAQRAPKER